MKLSGKCPIKRSLKKFDFCNFFAYNYSINYKTLKYLNPWLRENYLKNPQGNEFKIKIPKKGYRKFNKEALYLIDSIVK